MFQRNFISTVETASFYSLKFTDSQVKIIDQVLQDSCKTVQDIKEVDVTQQ